MKTAMTWAGIVCATLLSMVAVATASPARSDTLYAPKPAVRLTHPEWSKNAVLYQLNTRQFTKEGTLKAATAQLPRLKALGADVIWLMPIHEIGVKNRKGTLGSPYSVKDYYSVNPELGTLDDLKALPPRLTAWACKSFSTGWPTTPPGTIPSPSSTLTGTNATSTATSARRRGGTGRTSSISATPRPRPAST